MASPQIWHPFTQHGLREPIPQIVRGEGALLFDAQGNGLIDAISSWWVNTHGHAHPRIMNAIRAQTEKLDQIIFAGFTHDPAQQLAEELGDFLPESLSHIFFSDSGSTAVEVALKMALGLWHNRGTPRSRIVVMEHSYHGDTFGGMSVGERGVFNRAYAPLLFDVDTLPFPGAEDSGAATLAALEHLCADRQSPPAALIVEPLVLGAGGMMMYPPEILASMHALCKAYGVPFIADEVMTGWGRTGTLFACEQAGIVPDIMCLSKGLTGGALPLAITACTRAFYDAHLSDDRARMFFHSSSYTANPIACAAACANLAIWRDEPVAARIAAIADAHAALVANLGDHTGIADIRQSGTILAIDLAVGDSGYLSTLAPDISRFARARGVLLRPLGHCLYAMPPYCTTGDQLGTIHATMLEAVERFVAP